MGIRDKLRITSSPGGQMEQAPTQSRILKFGVFEIDLESGELRKSGMRQNLSGQPFEALRILLEHPQEIVTREELRQRLWHDNTFVDCELALKRVINRLRETLGDSAENPRFIETIPRRGYRFIAPMSGNSAAALPTVELPKASTTGPPALQRRLLPGIVLGLAAAALLLVLLALVSINLWQRYSEKGSASQIRSIAVLPLQNLSTDPAQEYFSDGMTDALITDLAQSGSLKVISRTSSMQYRQTKKSLPEIARELNVDGIIEGTVQRSGDRVRITAQLIYGPSDRHVWANSYERDMRDIFTLEREVTGDIAYQVQARLATPKQKLVPPRPVNSQVLEAYLQGSYHLNRYGKGGGDDEKRKAAEYFRQAIDADPNFAPAYNGLANAHLGLEWPSSQDFDIARRMAQRAVELDPSLSDARETLRGMEDDLDLRAAEDEVRHAIALNPNNAIAHADLAELLDATGRLDEGWREYQIAQELDPSHDHLSDAFEMRGQYDRAIAVQQMMLKRYPDDGYLHLGLFKDYVHTGMHKEAIQELEQTANLFGFPELASRIHRAFVSSGYRGAMRQYAKELEDLVATKQVFIPVNLAEVYATLGDKDRAFYWLEQAYTHHEMLAASTDLSLHRLNMEFLLDPIRSDQRFKDLVRRIGLPQ
jgi:TolB-like protein/DNA-binding winged helix-turn-helix (wHTH) protein/tetratricopeptide (TPR) repeat protein